MESDIRGNQSSDGYPSKTGLNELKGLQFSAGRVTKHYTCIGEPGRMQVLWSVTLLRRLHSVKNCLSIHIISTSYFDASSNDNLLFTGEHFSILSPIQDGTSYFYSSIRTINYLLAAYCTQTKLIVY